MKRKQKLTVVTFLMTIITLVTASLAVSKAYAVTPAGYTGSFVGYENLSGQALSNATNNFDVITDPTTGHISQMTANGTSVMEGAPQITVLTHGLGGSAADWSNALGNGGSTKTFQYDKNSMIESISNKANGANVVWAKMSYATSFYLYPLNSQKKDSAYETTATSLKTIDEVSKHLIIIFDASYSEDINLKIYQEFNFMLDMIVNDVRILNGNKLPRINLVGHSRGGLTNMQYALEHPDLIATLISIGTPYFGSNTAQSFGEAIFGASAGMTDIVTPNTYMYYFNEWNTHYEERYNKIKATAISAYGSTVFLQSSILHDQSAMIPNNSWKQCGIFFAALGATRIASLPVTVTDRLIAALLRECFPDLNESKVQGAMNFIASIGYDTSLELLMGMSVLYDDVLVHLPSQQGINKSVMTSPLETYDPDIAYKGFERVAKRFSQLNCNIDKVSKLEPPVVHNLEARDSQIVKKVVARLDLGIQENETFSYEIKPDDTVAITGLRESFVGDAVTIPATVERIGSVAFSNCTKLKHIIVEGENLKTIGDGAFLDCVSLESISATANLEIIGAQAFYNCKKLPSYAVGGKLTSIGMMAFVGCISMTSFSVNGNNVSYQASDGILYSKGMKTLISVPQGKKLTTFRVSNYVETLGEYAFYGQEALTSVSLPTVVEIEEGCFAACTKLIVVNDCNVIEKIGENAFFGTPWADNFSDQGFLTLGKVVFKYRNNGVPYSLTPSDFPVGATAIYDNAFMDDPFLTSVAFPNSVTKIGDLNFSNCASLQKVILPKNLETIGIASFANCPQLNDVTLLSPVPPALGALSFYDADENCAVKVAALSKEQYMTSPWWKDLGIDFKTIPTAIRFDSAGGDAYTPIAADYYSILSGIPTPSRPYRLFAGWYDADGNPYENGSLWDKTQDAELTAKWNAIQYAIRYNLGGGTNGENPNIYSCEDTVVLKPATRDNYIFLGWYNDNGARLERIESGSGGALNLTARWKGEAHTLAYTANGIQETKTVFYGEDFTLTVPIESGRYFIGWFRADGVQITDSLGHSFYTLITQDTELVAKWEISIQIKIDADGKVYWLGVGGITQAETSITPGREIVCPHCMLGEFAATPDGYLTGHYLHCFTESRNDESTTVECWKTRTSQEPFSDGELIELYAHFVEETYQFEFYNSEGFCIDSNERAYSVTAVCPLHFIEHYDLIGWRIVSVGGDADVSKLLQRTVGADGFTVFDFTPGRAVSVKLVVKLVPITQAKLYTVTVIDEVANTREDVQIRYGEIIPLKSVPVIPGYYASGYLCDGSFVGGFYPNDRDCTLSVIRQATPYTVKFNLNGGSYPEWVDVPNSYNIKTDTYTLPTLLPGTQRIGYAFKGWKNAEGNFVLTIPKGSMGNKVFDAIWIGKEYTTQYSTPSPKTYTLVGDGENFGYIILNMPSTTMNSATFIIADTVKELTIIGKGTPFLTFSLVADSPKLVLNLKDVSFFGCANTPAVTIQKETTLNIYGLCKIVGGQGESGRDGGSNPVLTYEASPGGTGAHGMLIVSAVRLDAANGKLRLYGGRGGMGGAGRTGDWEVRALTALGRACMEKTAVPE